MRRIKFKVGADRLSIKWKLFFYLAGLVGFVLVLLWLFQTVFLDSFYKAIKTQNIQSTAKLIVRNIDNEELGTLVDQLAMQNSICIRIVDEQNQDLYSSDALINCMIHRLKPDDLELLRQKAENNGGKAFEQLMREDLFRDDSSKAWDDKKFEGLPPFPSKGKDHLQSMISVSLVQMGDGRQATVMLNSVISPVNTTVETLRVQLLYVTGIFLLLSLLLAFLLSRKISAPIVKINRSAKELANGNYDTLFQGGGYLEIAQLNDTLNYAARELSKVEGLRRDLIANISHDLRTPLTMISGYGEVMRDLPGENTPENVQIIIDEARRLSELVTDILDLSKLQSGTQEVHLSRFSLTQNIRTILQRYAKLTEQDGYTVKFIADADAQVMADGVKLSQVIYNLINNAINYTGDDKRVTVCQSVEGNRVKIEIIDTGEGIEEEKLQLIWDRYYKVDKSYRRAAVGTGLGLSIVKTVLDLHHARYGVISTPGQGSIFWFELETAPNQLPGAAKTDSIG